MATIAFELTAWANATAATMTETIDAALAQYPDVDLRDVRAAFLRLSRNPYRGAEDPKIASRRATCGAIANALGKVTSFREDGDPVRTAKIWRTAVTNVDTSTPRGQAIAETLIREAQELE